MTERRLPAWLPSAAIAGALVALVAWSFTARWTMLTVSPFPVGIDGYFYPIQLRGLLEHGALVYPASPLTLWLMTPLAAITDPITGAKLGAALFGALIAVPSYGVGRQLGGSRGAGLIAAVLATTSAGSAFLTFEFVKNGIGLTIAMTALWIVLRAARSPTRGWLAGAVIAVIAAVLAHKLAAAIVISIAVPVAAAEAASRGVLRGRRWWLVGALAGVGALAIGFGLVFPERFITGADLALVGGLWTGDARWALPALARPNFVLAMGHEAVIGAVLAIGAAASLTRPVRAWLTRLEAQPRPTSTLERTPRRTAGVHVAAWIVVGLAGVIALPWLRVDDPSGLGFRIRIVAFVPMALCAAIAARTLYVPVAFVVGRLLDRRWWTAARELGFAAIALALTLAVPRDRSEGRIVAHPAMVAAVQALTGRVPDGATMIIPERHLMFMIAWYTRAPIRLRPEPVAPELRWRVMPLAFIRAGSPLDHALIAARRVPSLTPPLGTHPRHPNGLVLVTEPTWTWLLEQLPPAARARYAAWPTI